MRIQRYIIYIIIITCCIFSGSAAVPAQRLVGHNNTALNFTAEYTLPFATDDLGELEDSVPLTVKYYDGLGRHIQTFTGTSGSSRNGISDFIEYDHRGRAYVKWLASPSCDNSGTFTPLSQIKSSYPVDEARFAFTLTEYEKTPAGRTKGQRQPGKAWHDTSVDGMTTEYLRNSGSTPLNIRVINLKNSTLSISGWHSTNTLEVTRVINEDFETLLTFKDCRGKTLAIRNISAQGNIYSTYFVYDDLDRLRIVISPAGESLLKNYRNYSLSAKEVTDVCYIYEYDALGRIFSKHVPGAGRTYSITAENGETVFSTDDYLLSQKKTRWFLYDGLGRIVCQGVDRDSDNTRFASAPVDFPVSRTKFDADNGTLFGYTPVHGIESKNNTLTVDYYDNYDFLKLIDPISADSLKFQTVSGCDVISSNYTPKGNKTGNMLKVIGKDGKRSYIISAYYYDNKGRLIQTRTLNHLGGIDVSSSNLSFDGRPLYTCNFHSTPDTTLMIEREYSYISTLQLDKMKIRVNSGEWKTLSSTAYDELLRVTQSTSLDKLPVNFTYSLRGELESISSKPFTQTLFREKRPDGSRGYLCNKISGQQFTLNNTDLNLPANIAENLSGQYDYIYYASRLARAQYTELSRTIPVVNGVPTHITQDPQYSAEYTYDAVGNVTSIKRKGWSDEGVEKVITSSGQTKFALSRSYGLVDDLTLTYDGNRLKKVIDNAPETDFSQANDFTDYVDKETEYEYDVIGRLTKDMNKNITSISYNELGLPSDVMLNTSHIRYTYSADGAVLAKAYGFDVLTSTTPSNPGSIITYLKFNQQSRRDYVGPFEYADEEFERMHHECGWLNSDGKHTLTVKDYQGNIRATWTEGDAILVSQPGALVRSGKRYRNLTAYYPYGLPFADWQGTDRYMYSGKELDRTYGLNLYDFHARQQDPQLGRFTTPDPFADSFTEISPYTYCAADPINITDPSGMIINIIAGDKVISYDANIDTKDVFEGMEIEEQDKTFMSDVIGALRYIEQSNYGKSLIGDLINSNNVISITKGVRNSYSNDSNKRAFANLPYYLDRKMSLPDNRGSAGTVQWNNQESSIPYLIYDNQRTNAIGLAHELGHAWDADKGLLFIKDTDNDAHNLYYKGIPYGDWSAVYHENRIRSELNIPLREYYGRTAVPIFYIPPFFLYYPRGERMIDDNGKILFHPYLNDLK